MNQNSIKNDRYLIKDLSIFCPSNYVVNFLVRGLNLPVV